MHRFIYGLVIIILLALIGCAGGSSPTSPDVRTTGELSAQANSSGSTVLWGWYTVEIDPGTREVTTMVNRSAMFMANVVGFINGSPSGLNFDIIDVFVEPDYIDVDIDVSIRHPFPGYTEYTGYDVRGVFMGDGSLNLDYNPALSYADADEDQHMFADPVDGDGGPDGYTRWFNFIEFSEGGMPLFQYTQGKLASPGFAGTATLNPYKYFADGLGETDDLFTWLDGHADQNGRFASGAQNKRNYYLRFPDDKDVTFGYAITASWEGMEEEYHPANMYETAACRTEYNGNVYYIDESSNGGTLILDVDVFDWHSSPTSAGMEDYGIIFDSTVLSSPHEFDVTEMVPTDGNENYSTYHVELTADDVDSVDGNEYWIIVEYPEHDYQNDYDTPNLAGDDPLAAFFRFDLPVSPNPDNLAPVCDLYIESETQVGCGTEVVFNATGTYDPDGDPMTFDWDFDGDGEFGDTYTGPDDNPTYTYYSNYNGDACVRVSDGNGGESECCVAVDVEATAKNIDVTNGTAEARDLCIDHMTGDVLVLYDNGIVRNYHADDCYTSYNIFNTATDCLKIDMAPNGNWMTGWSDPWDGSTWGGRFYYYFYDHDGALIYADSNGWHQGTYYIKDVIAFGSNGEHANDIGFFWNLITGDGPPFGSHLWCYRDEDNFHSWWRVLNYYYTWPVTGIDKVYSPWVTGLETDRDNDWVWIVETEEYVGVLFDISGNLYDFQDIYFGELNVPGDDDSHIADPIDITRNDNNNAYLLDHLSTGDYVIKVWGYDETGTTSMGSFGTPSDFTYTPIALDGGDYDGRIAVLHTDESNAMISIFMADETPG